MMCKPLTKRQLEIIQLLAYGKNYEDIAKELWLSYNTIRTHLEKARQATETHSALQLVRYCFVNELIDSWEPAA